MAYNWKKKHEDSLTFGQKAADKMRNGLATWAFIFGFLGGMIAWMVWNMLAPSSYRFDIAPFIGLNLLLSTLAGLQGAILLIAAKRQDEISAALAQHDFTTNQKAEEEIRLVKSSNDMQHEKLDKIISLLQRPSIEDIIKRLNFPNTK